MVPPGLEDNTANITAMMRWQPQGFAQLNTGTGKPQNSIEQLQNGIDSFPNCIVPPQESSLSNHSRINTAIARLYRPPAGSLGVGHPNQLNVLTPKSLIPSPGNSQAAPSPMDFMLLPQPVTNSQTDASFGSVNFDDGGGGTIHETLSSGLHAYGHPSMYACDADFGSGNRSSVPSVESPWVQGAIDNLFPPTEQHGLAPMDLMRIPGQPSLASTAFLDTDMSWLAGGLNNGLDIQAAVAAATALAVEHASPAQLSNIPEVAPTMGFNHATSPVAGFAELIVPFDAFGDLAQLGPFSVVSCRQCIVASDHSSPRSCSCCCKLQLAETATLIVAPTDGTGDTASPFSVVHHQPAASGNSMDQYSGPRHHFRLNADASLEVAPTNGFGPGTSVEALLGMLCQDCTAAAAAAAAAGEGEEWSVSRPCRHRRFRQFSLVAGSEVVVALGGDFGHATNPVPAPDTTCHKLDHIENPYPSEEDRVSLTIDEDFVKEHFKWWFSNHRHRSFDRTVDNDGNVSLRPKATFYKACNRHGVQVNWDIPQDIADQIKALQK
ncbi:hypothetical protein GGF46_002648 [Coemansia sp. RSA 552]|nr:hypothetical protein GGF46_002648 [Coemansia sp. RSA 552]